MKWKRKADSHGLTLLNLSSNHFSLFDKTPKPKLWLDCTQFFFYYVDGERRSREIKMYRKIILWFLWGWWLLYSLSCCDRELYEQVEAHNGQHNSHQICKTLCLCIQETSQANLPRTYSYLLLFFYLRFHHNLKFYWSKKIRPRPATQGTKH